MTEKLNIVQSTTEPDKRNIWLKDNELKKFGAKGWSTIGGSNNGGNGGTSTDKDALDIYINIDNNILTVNDKQFNMGNIASGSTEIANKELYDILYNSLINTYRPVFIKTPPNSSLYIFGYATCVYMDNTITLSIYNGDLSLVVLVRN